MISTGRVRSWVRGSVLIALIGGALVLHVQAMGVRSETRSPSTFDVAEGPTEQTWAYGAARVYFVHPSVAGPPAWRAPLRSFYVDGELRHAYAAASTKPVEIVVSDSDGQMSLATLDAILRQVESEGVPALQWRIQSSLDSSTIVERVSHLSRLEELTLDSSGRVFKRDDCAQWIDAIVRLKHLRRLALIEFPSQDCALPITDDDLRKLVEGCPDLESLQLGAELDSSPRGMSVLRNLKRLHSLSFRRPYSARSPLTDQHVEVLSQIATCTKLDLGCASKLTNKSIDYLVQMKGLRRLGATDWTALDATAAATLGARLSIERLDLAHSRELNSGAITALAAWNALTSVDLTCCDIVDADVAALCRVETLRELNIQGCGELTVQSFRNIAKLDSLEILTCTWFESPGPFTALQASKSLKVLALWGFDSSAPAIDAISAIPTLEALALLRLTSPAKIERIQKKLPFRVYQSGM
jgi:hypothetical protein